MNTFFKILILLLCFYNSRGQSNQHACMEVEKKLTTIKNFVEGKDIDSTLRRAEIVAFFEKLTGITSESDLVGELKLEPTVNDYNKWNEWYKQNKSKLYWNKRKKKVIIKS